MFTELFMIRAFIAALLLAPLCALLGVFVTARKMAFFSDTIAHGALAGIAVGLLLGFRDLTVPMAGFGLLIALCMVWLRERTELLNDTIMALLLSGSVAFGIIILNLLKGHRGDIQGYLFGDILALGNKDLWLAAGLLIVLGGFLFFMLSPLSLLTANEELAHVCGVPVRRLNLMFLIGLTLAVALTIRLLGIVLVTALIVIPPAAARNISRNLRQQLIYSVLAGLTAGFAGTIISYQLDVPCGPAIVLSSIALFVLTLLPKGFSGSLNTRMSRDS